MSMLLCAVLIAGFVVAQALEIVSRDAWGARMPVLQESLSEAVEYVVVHHSYIPEACGSKEQCSEAMRWMQDFHQVNRSWNDIGYNFAVGGDGRAYTGRGWGVVGAHARSYNTKSVGICAIGDWTELLPPEEQLSAVKQLIALGVEMGHISSEYRLIGHRQASSTECPGQRLFAEIATWARFHDVPA